jgi:uncharacterized protein
VTRGGQTKENEDPERRCIASGESQPKGGLIRFVLGPETQVVADLLGKLPGRGFYVAADRVSLEKAMKKGLFARAARQPVTVPDTLLVDLENQLARRVVDLISLSRKAGEAVTGLEKVKDWLVKGRAEVLVQANDGSERERARLRPPEGPDSLITCLTAQELGLAFGRERAIHGALAAGGLTMRVMDEAARLAGVRNTPGGRVGGKTARKDLREA